MNEAVRVVSREQLHDVRRWAMPAMPAPAPPSPERPAQGPTVAELEAIGEAARREGYAQGLVEGREAARGELQHQLQQLRGLCDALARPLAAVDAMLERQLVELAMLVARRVLATELEAQPGHVLGVVRQAIAALPAATTQVDIHVDPQAAALLRDGLTEAADHGWRIVEDAHLGPGDCRLIGADSRIDASAETRLTALIDAALADVSATAPDDQPAPG